MNILTKICVVVLFVLILIACTVFINLATESPNYRKAFEDEQQRAELNAMAARHAELLNSALISQRDNALKRVKAAEDEQKRIVEQLRIEMEAERVKVANLQNDVTRMSADLTKLRINAEEALKRTDLLSTHLDDARAEIDTLTREKLELDDMLKQTQAKADRQEKGLRALQEEITERDEVIQGLREKLATGGIAEDSVAAEAAIGPARDIVGTVTAVKDDVASINLGSAKGIRPNMKLMIYRDEGFVGYLRVENVEASESAGFVFDNVRDAMPGDKVSPITN